MSKLIHYINSKKRKVLKKGKFFKGRKKKQLLSESTDNIVEYHDSMIIKPHPNELRNNPVYLSENYTEAIDDSHKTLEIIKLAIFNNFNKEFYDLQDNLELKSSDDGIYWTDNFEPMIRVENITGMYLFRATQLLNKLKLLHDRPMFSFLVGEHHKYFHHVLLIFESRLDILSGDDLRRILIWGKLYNSFLRDFRNNHNNNIIDELDIDTILLNILTVSWRLTDTLVDNWITSIVNSDLDNEPILYTGKYYSDSITFVFKFITLVEENYKDITTTTLHCLDYFLSYQKKIEESLSDSRVKFEHLISYINTSIKAIELFNKYIQSRIELYESSASEIVKDGFINIWEKCNLLLAEAILSDTRDFMKTFNTKEWAISPTPYVRIITDTIFDYLINDVEPYLLGNSNTIKYNCHHIISQFLNNLKFPSIDKFKIEHDALDILLN
jgi:hypothetical protein